MSPLILTSHYLLTLGDTLMILRNPDITATALVLRVEVVQGTRRESP